jgi:hypothetical protein
MTDWTQQSTLSATEIDVLAALDFEPAPSADVAAASPIDRRPISRTAEWLAVAYPHLTPQDRKIRATVVALLTLIAIVSITLILFGLTTQPISTP